MRLIFELILSSIHITYRHVVLINAILLRSGARRSFLEKRMRRGYVDNCIQPIRWYALSAYICRELKAVFPHDLIPLTAARQIRSPTSQLTLLIRVDTIE